MIKVKLITMGRLKEKYLTAACDEYKKRLSAYCNFEICEIEPQKLPDKPSESQIEKALEKEAEQIKAKIPSGSTVFAMCIEGKQFSSENFAKKIEAARDMGQSLVFIIGSSYGLSDTIKSLADTKLSVSEMTFPHQLFRVMLLEQIYRAFKINEGSAYHK
ncbi:MAG: 23S rRNA (pseudouridine(1915)-N(3))-methyltransferase RlmH [Clostridia bacterium]|nr:23S rRNA (pseudouridine(1915)-N(3))-methyltransferase RlmH [Clostridia bacterium]